MHKMSKSMHEAPKSVYKKQLADKMKCRRQIFSHTHKGEVAYAPSPSY